MTNPNPMRAMGKILDECLKRSIQYKQYPIVYVDDIVDILKEKKKEQNGGGGEEGEEKKLFPPPRMTSQWVVINGQSVISPSTYSVSKQTTIWQEQLEHLERILCVIQRTHTPLEIREIAYTILRTDPSLEVCLPYLINFMRNFRFSKATGNECLRTLDCTYAWLQNPCLQRAMDEDGSLAETLPALMSFIVCDRVCRDMPSDASVRARARQCLQLVCHTRPQVKKRVIHYLRDVNDDHLTLEIKRIRNLTIDELSQNPGKKEKEVHEIFEEEEEEEEECQE